MRIPIKVASWKSRALAAEQERDALQRELTMADAVETSLRASLDRALERFNAEWVNRAMQEQRALRAEAGLQRVRAWIETPSSKIRRATRVDLADHLGWPHPPKATKLEPIGEVMAEALADGIIR